LALLLNSCRASCRRLNGSCVGAAGCNRQASVCPTTCASTCRCVLSAHVDAHRDAGTNARPGIEILLA
jgi:hypothetical protein